MWELYTIVWFCPTFLCISFLAHITIIRLGVVLLSNHCIPTPKVPLSFFQSRFTGSQSACTSVSKTSPCPKVSLQVLKEPIIECPQQDPYRRPVYRFSKYLYTNLHNNVIAPKFDYKFTKCLYISADNKMATVGRVSSSQVPEVFTLTLESI